MRRIRNFAVDLVSRAPARVQTKLLVAFLAMVVLLVGLGAVGLRVVGDMSRQTEELIQLEHKIAAYRQVQHATTSQLYGVATALLAPQERVLDAILRQLSQFGYDLDRLEYVAQDEAMLMERVRDEYDRFIEIVTGAVELARAGEIEAAREVQRTQAGPLAERLERLTNQLVNVAEAAMLERITASQRAYDTAQTVVGAFALGSVILALGLGYVFSWSLVGPITAIEARLRKIAAGDFGQRVQVTNRDELGALAANINRTSEELGRLYAEVEERTDELSEALERQTATSEVLGVISRSTTELQPVLDTIVATAARLCHAEWAVIFRLEADGRYHLAAALEGRDDLVRFLAENPVLPRRGSITGRTVLEGGPVHVPDLHQDPEFTWLEVQARGGHRSVLGVPLLRGDIVIGVITLARRIVRPFTAKEIELVTTFADQAVIAIENVRLFDEVQARTRDLTEALEQQTATSAILRVISTSPTDVQPVFDTIVRNAVALCDSLFANVFRFDGELLHFIASHNVGPDYMELLRAKYPMRPDTSQVSGRAIVTRSVVRLEDALADPDYDQRFPAAMSWRRMLGVPMLRRGEPLGVIVVGWDEAGAVPKVQEELLKQFADQAVIAIENVRLFDEVQTRTRELTEALERQTATSEILRVIASSPTDITPVLNAVAESAARLCGAVDAQIFRVEGGVLRLEASFGSIPIHFREGVIDRSWVTGRAVVDRRTVHVADLAAESEIEYPLGLELQRQHGHRTTLATPLLRQGVALGAILIRRMDVDPFTDDQIRLLEAFADQAVIAIENVRLFDEVQARTDELAETLERQTATAEVLNVISRSTTEIQPVLDTIVATAAHLCRADWAHIHELECDGKFHLAASSAPDEDFVQYLRRHPVVPARGTLVGRTALAGRTVHLPNVLEDAEYTWSEAQARGRFRTLLGVPLLRGTAVIGVINLGREIVKPFSDKEIELVTTFADQAVIAIENVRLFDEVQARSRELERSVRELRALGEVSQAVNSSLELEAVLAAIAEHAVALAEADAGAFCAFDAEAQVFRIQATHALDPAAVAALTRRPVRPGEGAVGRAGLERQAVQIPDIDQEPGYALYDVIRTPGYRALLAVPLLRDETLVGGLVLCRKAPGAFPPETVDLVQTLANQSVLAIQNARLFQEIEQKGRELAEASRHKSEFLANMSHELRTPLNAVLGYAELIQDGIYGEVPEKIHEVLERIQQNGRHLLGLINDVLDLSKIEAGQLTLSPTSYSMRELALAVASGTEGLAREKGLALEVDVPADLPPGHGDERRVTQVLMNLVGNAIKFTETGTVAVRVRVDGDRFVVAVADTGPGIAAADQERIFAEFQQVDTSSTRKKGGTGLGLAIARRIVELHGGHIWVESTPGQGATFAFTLPISVQQQVAAA